MESTRTDSADQKSNIVWCPDLGSGNYKNPVICADYSDPDVVRAGADYWMTSSSFNHVPGLPILHSRDLVNWTLVNHALSALVPHGHFSAVRPGQGVWAPAIRRHAGRFWIYYPDPDFGIYAVTAEDPRGAWSEPALVKAGRGLIDPCPFWDDDGQAWLVFAWAKSRAGINNIISMQRLSADGFSVVGEDRVIIDGNAIPDWELMEGPKLYKRAGFYYIFAPAGGVEPGVQAVFRSRKIDGPYEHRIALERGGTPVNGPHQGAWVDTPSGEHWFLHFQKLPALGRVVHLQPMRWDADGWPRMGTAVVSDEITGNPVLTCRKPDLCGVGFAEPSTTDNFSQPRPGLQWQWPANPGDGWAKVDSAAQTLRLACVPMIEARSHWLSPNLLLQKFPAPAFSASVVMNFFPETDGAHAGLIMFGCNYAWLGLRRENGELRLVLAFCDDAQQGNPEQIVASQQVHSPKIHLRVDVDSSIHCRFSYSNDGEVYSPIGGAFQAASGIWVGAKVGLFASAAPGVASNDTAAFQKFTFTA